MLSYLTSYIFHSHELELYYSLQLGIQFADS